MLWDALCRWIGTLEGLLRQNSGVCASWDQDVRTLLARYYFLLDSEELVCPVELAGTPDPDERLGQLQNYVVECGQVLLHWPALWEAAKDLGESALRDAIGT